MLPAGERTWRTARSTPPEACRERCYGTNWRPDVRTEHEARGFPKGRLRLLRPASDPGFLPRGLALDGVSHYPNSSADQYTMILYAQHPCAGSGVAPPAEPREVETLFAGAVLKLLRLAPRKLTVRTDRANRVEGERPREPGLFPGADDHVAR